MDFFSQADPVRHTHGHRQTVTHTTVGKLTENYVKMDIESLRF